MESRMPAHYFALLCDHLKADGVDVGAALAKAAISPEQLYGADASISLGQFELLVADLERVSARNDLGFLLGRKIKLSNHEILGYALLTSPTLDYALQLAARYYRIITPAFQMLYRRGVDDSELVFRPILSLSHQGLRFLLETIVVSTHEALKSLTQEKLPRYEIFVSYSKPENAAHYLSLQPANIHFDHEDNPGIRMVLNSGALTRALPLADNTSLRMAESRCKQLAESTSRASQMTDWVRMMLRESSNGYPSLAQLAELLNQSPRTLDRQLKKEGSRFLDISKAIRHEKACAMLESGRYSVSQVALQLGYNEVASFSRAFRRESGYSPSEFIRQKVPEADDPRSLD